MLQINNHIIYGGKNDYIFDEWTLALKKREVFRPSNTRNLNRIIQNMYSNGHNTKINIFRADQPISFGHGET